MTDVKRLGPRASAMREALEIAGIATWEWFPATDEIVLSEWMGEVSGIDREHPPTLAEGLGFVSPSQRQPLMRDLRALVHEGDQLLTRIAISAPGSEQRWMEVRARPFRDDEGTVTRIRGTVQDVTELMHAAEEARLGARLLDEVDAAVIATDMHGRITRWSDGAQRLHGWTREEVLGRPITDLVRGDSTTAATIVDALDRTGRWVGELEIVRKDGTAFPAYVRNAAMHDEDGTPMGLIGVAVDISERLAAERELGSARDSMRAVTDSMGEGLCTIDRDGLISYTNPAAEQLLGWTGEELRGRSLHETTHFRHPDGTIFPAAECPIVRSRLEGVVSRVEDDLFIRKDGSELPVSYTAAPVALPGGEQGAVIVFSDITERKRAQERIERELEALTWLPRIRDALAQDRFVLHAQPIIDLATGGTVQHELLIRMIDEAGELVAPGSFLPPAERHGLIRDIDEWVIGQAARLAGQGHPVELNISAASLGDRDLYAVVEGALRDHGADPSLVVIEITETALLENEDVALEFLAGVERLGCAVALDDFGTGYGSFTYVKHLPVAYLKIDVEFVRDLPRDPASQHVVRAIVQLANGFGYRTVAEGVEDDESLQMLRDLGVDLAQGYALGRPAPLEQTALGVAVT